ncbi:membrane protein insertase YidC [Filimonas sp.]|nr:membrane protein insertase YidC [Filimonas sp.]
MDKNTLAGFGLLMLLLIGYIFYNQSAETKFKQKQTDDSISNVKLHPISPIKAATPSKDSSLALADSNAVKEIAEKQTIVENADLALTFTNKGGFPVKAELKKFKTFDGKPLILFNGAKTSWISDSSRWQVPWCIPKHSH